LSSEQLDKVIESHLVNPDLLRSAQFDEFFGARKGLLLEAIERAMRKEPVRDDLQPLQEAAEYEDEPDEFDDEDIVEPAVEAPVG
jgi:hypothetical protein